MAFLDGAFGLLAVLAAAFVLLYVLQPVAAFVVRRFLWRNNQ